MSKLTKSQIKFLEQHGVGIDQTFDAKGLKRSEYRTQMKAKGKIIAYNVTPCKKGHTLRSTSGQCRQCNPSGFGFRKTYLDGGFVYIAGTKKGRLIKVGFTKKVEIRAESLNRTKYANFSDWKILFSASCINAGKLESEIKKELSQYAYIENYDHNSKKTKADELYKCSYSKAKEKLLFIIEKGNYETNVKNESPSMNYDFPNLRRL